MRKADEKKKDILEAKEEVRGLKPSGPRMPGPRAEVQRKRAPLFREETLDKKQDNIEAERNPSIKAAELSIGRRSWFKASRSSCRS